MLRIPVLHMRSFNDMIIMGRDSGAPEYIAWELLNRTRKDTCPLGRRYAEGDKYVSD